MRLPILIFILPRLYIPQDRESPSVPCFVKQGTFFGDRCLLRENRKAGLKAFSQVRLLYSFYKCFSISEKNTEKDPQDLAHEL